MKKQLLALGLLSISMSSFAINIAVIDGGVDFSHKDLKAAEAVNMFESIGEEGYDDDYNGYIDDYNGWNFVKNNNKTYFNKLENLFNEDVFYLNSLDLWAEANFIGADAVVPEGRKWLSKYQKKTVEQRKKAVERKDKFNLFARGTHLAGILAQVETVKITAIKTIDPIADAYKAKKLLEAKIDDSKVYDVSGAEYEQILAEMRKNIKVQADKFKKVLDYLDDEEIPIALIGFNINFEQAKFMVQAKYLRKKVPSKQLLWLAVDYVKIMNEMITAQIDDHNVYCFTGAAYDISQRYVSIQQAPNFPNTKYAKKLFAVGASYAGIIKATHSGFGSKDVDIFENGIGVYSAVPGNAHMYMSGSAQAAANVVKTIAYAYDAANERIALKDLIDALFASGNKTGSFQRDSAHGHVDLKKFDQALSVLFQKAIFEEAQRERDQRDALGSAYN